METKSRYEVISDLETQKRGLIRERDGQADEITGKKKELKVIEQTKTDQMTAWDRKIEDAKEDLANFEKTMKDRKETLVALIASIDDSLNRFSALQKKA